MVYIRYAYTYSRCICPTKYPTIVINFTKRKEINTRKCANKWIRFPRSYQMMRRQHCVFLLTAEIINKKRDKSLAAT